LRPTGSGDGHYRTTPCPQPDTVREEGARRQWHQCAIVALRSIQFRARPGGSEPRRDPVPGRTARGAAGCSSSAIGGSTPTGPELRRPLRARLGECTPDPIGIEVGDVDRGAGLLPPRLVQPARIDGVEAEFVD